LMCGAVVVMNGFVLPDVQLPETYLLEQAGVLVGAVILVLIVTRYQMAQSESWRSFMAERDKQWRESMGESDERLRLALVGMREDMQKLTLIIVSHHAAMTGKGGGEHIAELLESMETDNGKIQ